MENETRYCPKCGIHSWLKRWIKQKNSEVSKILGTIAGIAVIMDDSIENEMGDFTYFNLLQSELEF